MRFLVLLVSLFIGAQAAAQNACSMQGGMPIFCDTFDTRNNGTSSRTGDLDPNVWGVSRTHATNNFGQQQYNTWPPTIIQKCDGTTPRVLPPNDVIICNGQLRQALNDNVEGGFEAGTVAVMALYPKQPFDFAGRTGTVSFDVSNDTHGIHAAWPEFWMSDLPVPAPFNHFDSWVSFPKNGFGIRFAAGAGPNDPGSCQNLNNLDKQRWTVDSAVVVRNYVYEDSQGFGVQTGMRVQQLDCVIAAPGPNGPLNHVELKISQSQIEVWASDAGTAALRKIAVVTGANLSLTRGLIWLQDAHYNADKGQLPSQREHTFTWDNVAFDGPFTYRDFSYDALDNNAPGINGSVNLGKVTWPNDPPTSWSVLNVPANPQAAAVRVLFNFFHYDKPTSLLVTVNGHSYTQAWPYPDSVGYTGRTTALTIALSDLVAGTNVVTIKGSDQPVIVSNVNIVLVNVPGGVPVLPGSNNAYPGGAVPPTPVNGVCGGANGTTVPTAPTANLCASGMASVVSGIGPWTWTCVGANGGTTASCSANKTAPPPTVTCTVPSFTFPATPGNHGVAGTIVCR